MTRNAWRLCLFPPILRLVNEEINEPTARVVAQEKVMTQQGPIKKAFELGLHWEAIGPFLFIAHHHEAYPKAKEDMSPDASLEGRNIGQDFDLRNSWRMYHGDKIPGFPAHPHRGFETVSIVRQGYVDHADSLGAAARYGQGDVQWLTTGGGIMHSEMFPLVHTDRDNPLEMFQLWLNLPKKSKMVPAHFKMFWANSIPKTEQLDAKGRKTALTYVAGRPLFDEDFAQNAPPPDSWAADAQNDVRIVLLRLDPHAEITLPGVDAGIDRGLYAFEGGSFSVNGLTAPNRVGMILDSTEAIDLVNGEEATEFLLLEGRPINEPVAQQGPFVMNSRMELQQAMLDFQTTRFGGWDWPSDAPVHARDAGRFAQHPDGTVDRPSDA